MEKAERTGRQSFEIFNILGTRDYFAALLVRLTLKVLLLRAQDLDIGK